ncbi:MAG: hypothetical protein HYR94_16610 [Chloroflexi bacterium]|nr:hypothetical protein [Chloroflexota bacterium]
MIHGCHLGNLRGASISSIAGDVLRIVSHLLQSVQHREGSGLEIAPNSF